MKPAEVIAAQREQIAALETTVERLSLQLVAAQNVRIQIEEDSLPKDAAPRLPFHLMPNLKEILNRDPHFAPNADREEYRNRRIAYIECLDTTNEEATA
jgi:hypothetical protein